jgi:hypothetical protein
MIFPSSLGNSMQWIPLLPKGGGLIQVDIGGHPPVPNSNWLILTVFSSTHFSVMGTFLCNCGFCTYGAVLESLHNIQVDIGGLPPIPTGLFWNFSCQYIFLYFQGHFGALNNVFLACHSQTIDEVRV